MKTKILSLALALMMIVSVMAALPVVAEEVDNSVHDVIVAAATATTTSLGGGPYKDSVPVDDHGWVPTGNVLTNASSTITKKVEITASGYYDVYVATTGFGTSYKGHKFGFYCDDTLLKTNALGAEKSTTTQVDFGSVYLEAGERTIALKASSTGNLYIYGFKLAYRGAEASETIIDSFIMSSYHSGNSSPYWYGAAVPDYDWIPVGNIIFGSASNGAYATHTVTAPKSGYYALTLGISRYNTAAFSATVHLGEDLTLHATKSVAAGGAKYDGKPISVGNIYLEEGPNKIQVKWKTGTFYYHGIKLEYKEQYTIGAESTAGGSVTGSATVFEGESVTLTATPEAGYIFDGWYDGATKVGGATTLAIESASENKTYTAKFRYGVLINPRSCNLYEDATPSDYLFTHWNGTPNYVDMEWGNGASNDLVAWFESVEAYKDNLNTTVNVVKAGYYDVYLAAGTTADVFAKALANGSTTTGTIQNTGGVTTVKENNIGRLYLAAGDTLTLHIKSTVRLYLYDIMLRYSDDQTAVVDIEPIDGTPINSSYTWESTAEPETSDNNWADVNRVYIYQGSKGYGVKDIPYTVREAGYYDVYAAVGYVYENGELILDFNGIGTVQGKVAKTSTSADVKTTLLGRLYFPAGAGTLDFRAALWGSGLKDHIYVYDIRLERSSSQAEDAIIINASSADSYSSTGEMNRYDWDYSSDETGWATNGTSKFTGYDSWADYGIYVPSSGYYDVEVAAGTVSAAAGVSVGYNGTRFIDSVILPDSTSLSKVKGAYVGQIYLPAGKVQLKVAGSQSVSSYYLYNIKLTKSATQPENDVIKVVNEKNTEKADGSFAGSFYGYRAWAEVKTTADDVKVFVANYKDLGNGLMEMIACQEGVAVVTDGGTKIIRTPALDTTPGIIKAFIWDGTTFEPISIDTATVVAPK